MKERCFYCRKFYKGLFLDNFINTHYVFICSNCIKNRNIYLKEFIKNEKKIPIEFNFNKNKI